MEKTSNRDVQEEKGDGSTSGADDGSQKTDVCRLDLADPGKVYSAWLEQQAHKANEYAQTVQSSIGTVTNTVTSTAPNAVSSAPAEHIPVYPPPLLLTQSTFSSVRSRSSVCCACEECNGGRHLISRGGGGLVKRRVAGGGSPSQEVTCIHPHPTHTREEHLSVALVFSHPGHSQSCLNMCSMFIAELLTDQRHF